ncbi:MAG TPA: hypothetical protein VGS12_17330 [Caulobacteraceae bacterium]|nr:hypothetical protein [Caulobacteraceae bacterium]
MKRAVAAIAKQLFNDDFDTIFRCRNHVAHGVLLGIAEDGDWAFLTSRTQPPVKGSAVQETASYNTESLRAFADAAERAIPEVGRLPGGPRPTMMSIMSTP